MEYFEGDLEKKLEQEKTKAAFFVEALPYIKKFRGKYIVIKIGGKILDDPELKNQLIEDVVMLHFVGLFPIIVHGGGVQINHYLKEMHKEFSFDEQGRRVTDDETMPVVQMVLSGLINPDLVASISRAGASAIGISGQSGRFISASPLKEGSRVGQIEELNASFLERVLHHLKMIPVVAPIGIDSRGRALNINADEVAVKIAADLCVEKLIFVSDVDGISHKDGGENKTIKKITDEELKELEQSVSKGMAVKVSSIKKAIEEGVASVQIISGKRKHSLLLEIFTDDGVGTQILRQDNSQDN